MRAPASVRVRAAAIAALVFALGVPVVGALLFLPVLMLAGPHSDLLPGPMRAFVVAAGWLLLVVVPAWVARGVRRRYLARVERRRDAA